jgi:diguanylate cyclase (GGDEF)-like protein
MGKHRFGTWRTLLSAMFVLCTLAATGPRARAQSPLELTAQATELSLAPHTRYYHDPAGGDDLAAAQRWLANGRFEPLEMGNTSFGFKQGAFWFHADLVNRDSPETTWLLVQEYALSDRVDVYVRHADGRVVHQAGGDHLPFEVRSVRYRHPNFSLAIPAGGTVSLLVRVQSESSMQVPLVLYTPTAFTEQARDAQFAIGLYYGILLALFTYNLVLWLTLRDASYVWYLFHITAFGLVLFTLNGMGFEYFWPASPWLADHAVPLSICLALIGMQQFSRKFLELHQRWRVGDRVALGIIAFFLVLGVASVFYPYRLVTPIASLAVFPNIGWILVSTIVVLRRGYKPAKLFLLAWSLFLLGTAMFSAVAFNLLPKNFITEYGVQIGSALEMLLLSVALGYRYAALRNENERIVRESRDQLEHKVELRTAELRNALGQLEQAHHRLREFSRHDGLTDLYNRTHFHEAFERLLADARDGKQPISLLMIDLDHFKRINDTYGHLVGDDCLRWTSNTMAETLRPYDALLARFGGEEFIAALPGMNLHQAKAVAEEVRQRLRSRPCRSGDHDIPISASIGVHSVDTAARSSIDSALQVADQALYAAKAEGRDCVRTL